MRKIKNIREIDKNTLYLCEGFTEDSGKAKFVITRHNLKMIDVLHLANCDSRGKPNINPWGPIAQSFFKNYKVVELGTREENPEYFL